MAIKKATIKFPNNGTNKLTIMKLQKNNGSVAFKYACIEFLLILERKTHIVITLKRSMLTTISDIVIDIFGEI